MAKKSTRRSMKKTHRKRSVKRSQRTRRMRGGSAPVTMPTTSENLSLPQGLAYYAGSPMGKAMTGGMSKDAYGGYGNPLFGMIPATRMQQGGSAPYPGSVEGVRLLAPGMEQAAGTGRIDGALAQVAGLRDPNQVGGRKRKSKKSTRKAKKSRKSKKSVRKTRKAKKSRKSKKSTRKTRKAKKSRKGRKAGRKAHRRGRKPQRGGEMDYSESMNGGILPSDLAGKAGLHRSWSDVAAGRMV